MSSADQHFLTPEAKHLLRLKNKLMRAGRVEQASAIARRVGMLIVRATSGHLRDIDHRTGPSELWRRVGEITKGPSRKNTTGSGLTAEELNTHYAEMSTDDDYAPPANKQTAPTDQSFITEQRVFQILDRLHHTADR